jgi:hypothetical protein
MLPPDTLTEGSTRYLRATGWSRYFDAAFLMVWLAFWFVGEAVSLALIGGMVAGAVSTALGRPAALASRVVPITDGSVAFFLLFLLLWTALWTVGGIAAISHLLRRIGGDAVSVTGGEVRLEWRAWPFRRRRRVPISSIRRIRLAPAGGAVVLDTAAGTLTVTDLGTAAARASLKEWLAERLPLPSAADAQVLERETAPRDRGVRAAGGATIVTRTSQRARRIVIAIGWVLAALVSLGWIGAVRQGAAGSSAAGVLTLFVVAAATWMTVDRAEWILTPGRFRIRRRFAAWTLRERTFAAGSILDVEEHRDSDGDDHYALVVRDGAGRRVLARALHDPYELLALGEWLSRRTEIPFHRPGSL